VDGGRAKAQRKYAGGTASGCPGTLWKSPGSICLVWCMWYYVRGVGVMRGTGQMLKIYLPVQPRGMAGGNGSRR
jgi:hypothetical protein